MDTGGIGHMPIRVLQYSGATFPYSPEANTFLEDLSHPIVRRLFLHWKELYNAVRRSTLYIPVPSSL